MRLSQLKKAWSYMSLDEKLSLVENTNKRRREAFEIAKRKPVRKKSTTKRRKSSKKKLKTADDLQDFMQNMTPEERENFKLALLTGNHGN